MVSTESGQNAGETAARLAQWLQSREQLKAAGQDVSGLDQQILPFKTRYVRSGAIYGANSAGMVRWYAESPSDGMASLPSSAPKEAV